MQPEEAHQNEHTTHGLDRLDLKHISTRIGDPIGMHAPAMHCCSRHSSQVMAHRCVYAGATIIQVAMEKVLWRAGLFTLPPTVAMCIKSSQVYLAAQLPLLLQLRLGLVQCLPLSHMRAPT